MKKLILIYLLSTTIYSCNNSDYKYLVQFDVIDKFLTALLNNNVVAVKRTLAADAYYVSQDSAGLTFYTQKLSGLLQKFGIPKESAFIVKEFPKNSSSLIDVTVPIVKNKGSDSRETEIEISFDKFHPGNIISNFKVIENYSEPDPENLMLPPDSIKHR